MDNYVANVIPHLQQWWPVLVRLAYLVGVAFAVVSLGQAISHKHRFNRSTAVRKHRTGNASPEAMKGSPQNRRKFFLTGW